MTVKSELLEIKEASKDRMLHAEAVIKWAKAHKASAIYSAIEWDDRKAAGEYRLYQVRKLIALYISVSETEGPNVISLTADRVNGGGYRDVQDVMARPDLKEIMLNDALIELQRVQKKYQLLKELDKVWAAASKVREKQATKSTRAGHETGHAAA